MQGTRSAWKAAPTPLVARGLSEMSVPPPISVLLPVRNGSAHLGEAIESLATQTHRDFEIIVVDDGSTDSTPKMLREWAERDERVVVVRQPALGIVPALEAARERAQGTYLARMDADDISEPTRFARQLELIERDPSIVAVGSRIQYFPPSRVRDGAKRYQRWMNASIDPDEIERELFVECPLAHPTFFMRADAVDAVGGYRDMGWPEDYDLILRLWRAGGRFAKVPDVLLRWRERDSRLSRTDPRYAPEAFLRCKVRFLSGAFNLDTRPVVVWGAGPVGKALAKQLAGVGVKVAAFSEVDPRKIGQEIHGAPVLDAESALARRGALHLAAVGQEGARRQLRAILGGAGLTEMDDFVAMA